MIGTDRQLERIVPTGCKYSAIFVMAPIEPTMATPVAACESIVAVGVADGICVGVFVAEGAKVAVTAGEGEAGLTSGGMVVAERGDSGGTGVCVADKA
jgi:hypothetical protein